MRYFVQRSSLAQLDFNTRLIITYFLVYMLLASGFAVFMGAERTSLSAAGASSYYRGDESSMQFAMERAELTEITHFHLFTQPLILLATGHLFLLSRWGRWRKTVVITTGFAGSLLHVAKPWLIRFGSDLLAWAEPIAAASLGLSLLVCCAVPLWEMWVRPDYGGPEASR